MAVHDDHRGNDEAHVLSLRLALGSILSPKRPQITRSSTTNSGTASPATHCPHSAFPLPHAPALTPPHSHSAPPHAHHHVHGHSHLNPDRAHADQPAMPHTGNALDETHPHMPDAVVAAAAPLPTTAAGTPSGSMTPNGRWLIVETLQNKSKSWDALIHGFLV
ncbi:hypothetical protein K466DRAFT_578252 [Polyporus arcularius HHB13444]|uniref:Uncharacterized protein n=1 Tax=Polyporus arcularius HHB13444 TaxID=1314778 RepID=A0A5C3NXV0_9APHY|nr:hypothetical protein K466DRAFT_578252 [Polyporus arcularius HHB13444]